MFLRIIYCFTVIVNTFSYGFSSPLEDGLSHLSTKNLISNLKERGRSTELFDALSAKNLERDPHATNYLHTALSMNVVAASIGCQLTGDELEAERNRIKETATTFNHPWVYTNQAKSFLHSIQASIDEFETSFATKSKAKKKGKKNGRKNGKAKKREPKFSDYDRVIKRCLSEFDTENPTPSIGLIDQILFLNDKETSSKFHKLVYGYFCSKLFSYNGSFYFEELLHRQAVNIFEGKGEDLIDLASQALKTNNLFYLEKIMTSLSMFYKKIIKGGKLPITPTNRKSLSKTFLAIRSMIHEKINTSEDLSPEEITKLKDHIRSLTVCHLAVLKPVYDLPKYQGICLDAARNIEPSFYKNALALHYVVEGEFTGDMDAYLEILAEMYQNNVFGLGYSQESLREVFTNNILLDEIKPETKEILIYTLTEKAAMGSVDDMIELSTIHITPVVTEDHETGSIADPDAAIMQVEQGVFWLQKLLSKDVFETLTPDQQHLCKGRMGATITLVNQIIGSDGSNISNPEFAKAVTAEHERRLAIQRETQHMVDQFTKALLSLINPSISRDAEPESLGASRGATPAESDFKKDTERLKDETIEASLGDAGPSSNPVQILDTPEETETEAEVHQDNPAVPEYEDLEDESESVKEAPSASAEPVTILRDQFKSAARRTLDKVLNFDTKKQWRKITPSQLVTVLADEYFHGRVDIKMTKNGISYNYGDLVFSTHNKHKGSDNMGMVSDFIEFLDCLGINQDTYWG